MHPFAGARSPDGLLTYLTALCAEAGLPGFILGAGLAEGASWDLMAPGVLSARGEICEDGKVEVFSSNQSLASTQSAVASALGVKEADVTLVCRRAGGGSA